MFANKNYTYTKLNCLKFNSALNDAKRVDPPEKNNQPTNLYHVSKYIVENLRLLGKSLNIFCEVNYFFWSLL